MIDESLTLCRGAAFMKIRIPSLLPGIFVMILACAIYACSSSNSKQQNTPPDSIKKADEKSVQHTVAHTEKGDAKSGSSPVYTYRNGQMTGISMDWI